MGNKVRSLWLGQFRFPSSEPSCLSLPFGHRGGGCGGEQLQHLASVEHLLSGWRPPPALVGRSTRGRALASAMSDPEDEDETCWNNLESFRVKLISVIDPSRLTPYLRQCKVLSHDDEEQILNDPSLVVRKRKAGVLLDILQRTGQKGFVAFLESLELYYPHLYKKVTGNDPTRVFSAIIDAAGESSLTELLMNEITKLQGAIRGERHKLQELSLLLQAKEDLLKELRVRDNVLRKHQERAHKMKEERDRLGQELRRCKEENYQLALSYAKQSEEKNAALMRNRDLQLEIDCLRHSLLKAKDDCKLERKHTLKLRHAMEQRPSHEAVWEMQRQKDLLLAKNKELESTLQVTKEGSSEKDGSSVSLQAFEAERTRMSGEHQEMVNAVHDIRQVLRKTEESRNKQLVEEKEMLELQCTSLQNDAQIYQDRIEAILKQMEEVAAERDQALLTQEAFHKQFSQSLVDKDAYRKQIRELGERCDELQLQLFQKEGQLLSAEAKLKRLRLDPATATSDLEETSSRSSQELTPHGNADEDLNAADKHGPNMQDRLLSPLGNLRLPKSPVDGGPLDRELVEKERRRMKDGFEHCRRKRALRRVQKGRYHKADWENTTGSDNSDTEGS
ncbi:caspase recruitment domain-containing protein 9 isoform X3 [Hemicordylus capensis]|uniref:caspase recruitment domain-containing protein 9 isoform X3 n=1 Tax=Hemicordylus capensis TaxID=884348 RepID=UPI00230492B7|nr:caspase recruitment domain-containing protein 9 isoform X3 [Hemicordylus capensis]